MGLQKKKIYRRADGEIDRRIDRHNTHTQIYTYLYIRVLNYRSRGPGFDSRALQKKVVGLERGSLSLVSTTEKLLDRKAAAPV
jgi:hypothetical protein